MPGIPVPNQPFPEPTPADPSLAPGRPPQPGETPLPEPIGVPSPAPEELLPPNELVDVPPTTPPEIPVMPTTPQPQA